MDIALVILVFVVVVIALVWITNVNDDRQAKRATAEKERQRGLQEASLEKARLAKQSELREAANELRRKEAARLTQSMIPSLGELRALTPQQFEDAVAKMFTRLGYSVTQTPYSHDEGYDGVLNKDGQEVLYECKRYGANSTSGRPDLQIFASAIRDNDAVAGFFLTTGVFSQEAVEYAKGKPIELISGTKLLRKFFESNADTSQLYDYKSMCRTCGEIVIHQLRMPKEIGCSNSHIVQPTLTVEQLLVRGSNPPPICRDCGIPMLLRDGRRGQFWGCPNFSTKGCRYTLQYEQATKSQQRRRRRRRR